MSVSTKIKNILLVIAIILALAISILLIWMATEYKADDIALNILHENENVTVAGNVITITSESATDTAIIFYPGARVESIAYLPLLNGIADECDVTCYLVEMPINHAIFDSDAAEKIINVDNEINNWYMAGHSLGGAMASDYASNNIDLIEGVIVMGASVYGNYPKNQSLTIYGTFNSEIADYIDYTENIVVIEGGNHAQFGNYGKQSGDPDATITAQQQQQQTIEAIKLFLDGN